MYVDLKYLFKYFNNLTHSTSIWAYIYLRLSLCPHNIVVINQQVLTKRARAVIASHLDKPERKIHLLK